MSIDDLIKKVDKLGKGVDRAVEVGARNTLSVMVERIFTRGLNSDRRKIGVYDTKPIYIPHDRAPRSKKGSKGLTGRADNTYFAGGYKEFKSKMGLGEKVNFRLFGELLRDFAGGGVPQRLGFAAFGIVLNKDINLLKQAGLEAKFGDVFKPTSSEVTLFNKEVQKELNKLL